MNIMSYLNQPSFEDFVDSPAVTDLAHNTPSATGEAAPAAAATTEAPADNIEIPETTGPELIASADEAQAAAIVEDPGHSEAEQMAQAASAQDTALLEAAEVTPGAETAVTEETTEAPAGDEAITEEVSTDAVPETDATTDVGGDSTDTSGELGDVAADAGTVDASGELPLEETPETTEETTSEEIPAGDDSGDAAVTEEVTTEEPAGEEPLEEDGLSEVSEPETEETEDGLGDGTDGNTETGETETNTDDQEVGGEETEGEEETGEAEESTSEEVGGEEESTTEEESGEVTEDDDEEGVDYDIPEVDTEIEDEDVESAETDAEEAAAEEEELDEEIVDTSKSVAELDKEEVAVEAFIGVLQHGIHTKKFTPQTVALAQDKLQALCGTFRSESPVIPSMEDYTVENLGAYYTNSLESFSDFLKKIRTARKSFFDDFAKKMNDKIHLKAVETQIDALNKVCDQQIVRVKDLTLETPLKTKIPSGIRHKDGVVKGMTSELAWLNGVAGVFKFDETFNEAVAKILKQAIAEGDSVKATDLANKALKVPLPAKKYPAAAFSGSTYLPDLKFAKSDIKATGSLVEDMKSLASRAIPEMEGTLAKVATGPAEGEFKKTDLVKMLQICKIMIGLSRGTAASAGKALVGQLDGANRTSSEKDLSGKKTGDKEAQRRGEAAMNQLVTQFWYALSRSLDNYSQFQWQLVNCIDGMLQIVKRAK